MILKQKKFFFFLNCLKGLVIVGGWIRGIGIHKSAIQQQNFSYNYGTGYLREKWQVA